MRRFHAVFFDISTRFHMMFAFFCAMAPSQGVDGGFYA